MKIILPKNFGPSVKTIFFLGSGGGVKTRVGWVSGNNSFLQESEIDNNRLFSCRLFSNRPSHVRTSCMKQGLVTAKQIDTATVESSPGCCQSTSSEVFLSVVCRRLIHAALSLPVDHSACGRYVQTVTTSCAESCQ